MSRLFRGLVIALALAVLLPIGCVALVALWAQRTQMPDESYPAVFEVVGRFAWSAVSCGVVGCEPELLEGMETRVFDETLLRSTPVAFDVDEWGRLLVAETGRQNAGAEDNRSHPYWLEDDLASRTVADRVTYYEKWLAAGRFEDPDHFTRESDRLVVLEDTDGDGVADSRRELASWNAMASGLVAGVEARSGEIWVTSIPDVRRLRDADRDGVAESEEVLQTGFGVKTSLIGHDLHGLAWGPDGKLYFSMGDRGYSVVSREGQRFEPSMGPGRGAVFRMNPDGSALEVFATGVRNPQELAFDDYGNLFTGDNNGDGGDRARLVYLVEGGETGWAMPYQTLVGDYIRGPWVAERLWETDHPTRPAWVLPPIGYVGNGPAGFVHYPGLGLPERYADHFFLCDYAYTPARSGIWSFSVRPAGAGMEMVGLQHFAWNVLATDFDFSWDGRLFATWFDQFAASQHVLEMWHPASRADPRVAELTALAQTRMRDHPTERLIEILSFPDQRLRLRAQYALAERGAVDALRTLASSERVGEVARLHGLWGLGQIGADALAPILADAEWLAGRSEEFRAQVARVAGDAGASDFAPTLRAWLGDASSRVRFFAAQSLGALADRRAVPELARVLRENADADVFLRHAVVWAWHRIGDLEAVHALRDDASRSVRLGVLLALRHARDGRIAHFLADPDPLLVVEAARAIYDLPIDGAMPALAALASTLEPAAADDRQTGQALHRRVIGANVRLRSEDGATALARYVQDERQLGSLRAIALEQLGTYTTPPPRDLTSGFHRPLIATDAALLARVFQLEGRGLLASDMGARAMEIASRIGHLPLSDRELVEVAERPGEAPSESVAALRALAHRAAEGPLEADPTAAIEIALARPDAGLRIAALDLLRAVAPAEGLARLIETARAAPTEAERQHAWRALGRAAEPAARAALAAALDRYERGQVEPAVALDVLLAAREAGGTLAERAAVWLTPAASAGAEAVTARRWALAGGDAEAGRAVFQTVGDCQRCHGDGLGHGAGAGPALARVSERGATHVLRSVLDPGAELAPGFEQTTITLADGETLSGIVAERTDEGLVLELEGGERRRLTRAEIAEEVRGGSSMPPMGLMLSPERLRDVVAYVMTL